MRQLWISFSLLLFVLLSSSREYFIHELKLNAINIITFACICWWIDKFANEKSKRKNSQNNNTKRPQDESD